MAMTVRLPATVEKGGASDRPNTALLRQVAVGDVGDPASHLVAKRPSVMSVLSVMLSVMSVMSVMSVNSHSLHSRASFDP
jgi:hypothetical protein